MKNIIPKKRQRIETYLNQTDSSLTSSDGDEDYTSKRRSFKIKRKRMRNIFNNSNRACNYRPSIISRHFADKQLVSSTPRNDDKKTTAIHISQNISSIDVSQITKEANTSSSKFGELNEESGREDNLLQKNKDIRENCMRAAERRLTQWTLKNKISKIPIGRLTDVNRNKTSQKLQYNSSYKFKSSQQNSANDIVNNNCSQIQENLCVNPQRELEKIKKAFSQCEENEIYGNNLNAGSEEATSISEIESFYEKRSLLKKKKTPSIKVLQNTSVCPSYKCSNTDSSSHSVENVSNRYKRRNIKNIEGRKNGETVKNKLQRSHSSVADIKKILYSHGIYDISSASEDECRPKKLRKTLSEDTIPPSYPEAKNHQIPVSTVADNFQVVVPHESKDVEVRKDTTLNSVMKNKTNNKKKRKTPCKTNVTRSKPVTMVENISITNKSIEKNAVNKSLNKRKSETHREENEPLENISVTNTNKERVNKSIENEKLSNKSLNKGKSKTHLEGNEPIENISVTNTNTERVNKSVENEELSNKSLNKSKSKTHREENQPVQNISVANTNKERVNKSIENEELSNKSLNNRKTKTHREENEPVENISVTNTNMERVNKSIENEELSNMSLNKGKSKTHLEENEPVENISVTNTNKERVNKSIENEELSNKSLNNRKSKTHREENEPVENISVANTNKERVNKSIENEELSNKSLNKRKSKTHREENETVENISVNKVTNKRILKTQSKKNKTKIIPEDAVDNTINTHKRRNRKKKMQHGTNVMGGIELASTSIKNKQKTRNTSEVKDDSIVTNRELRELILKDGSNRDDMLQTINSMEENETMEISDSLLIWLILNK